MMASPGSCHAFWSVVLAAVSVPLVSQAQTPLYWDTDGPGPGLGCTTPDVDWLTNSWSVSASGADPAVVWPNAALTHDQRAIFGGSAGSVSVGADVFVNAIHFSAPGYLVQAAGGAIHLAGSEPTIDVTLASGLVTITAPLTGTEGLRLTGSSNDGSLEFLVLANADLERPNDFSGTLAIADGGALRLGGGVGNEQIPDEVDLTLSGVIDFITTGGASDGKRETLRDVAASGPRANFSVGNGTRFEVNSLSASNTTGSGVAVNGNAATVPGQLLITGWADGKALLSLDNGLVRVNTTGATAAIGGRIALAGNLISRGNSEVSNKNGGGATPETNEFDNRAFDFAGSDQTVDVVDGVLKFTSISVSRPLDVNATSPEGTRLTKLGAGTWSWENAVEGSFTGTHRIEAGVWRLSGPARWSEAVHVEVAGGELELAGFGQSVASVLLAEGEINGSVGSFLASSTDFVAQAGSVSVALDGDVGLVKTGAGSVTLLGTNTYRGATTLSEGLLQVDGDQLGGGPFDVARAGVLGGSGVIEAAVGVDGAVAPGSGSAIGSLGVGDIEFRGGSRLSIEIAGSEADALVAGGLSVARDARLTVTGRGGYEAGLYSIARYTTRTGEFVLDAPPGFSVQYDDADGSLWLLVAEGMPAD